MAPRVNIPPVTRVLLITLLAFSFLYNLSRWRQVSILPQGQTRKINVPYLALVPADSILNPWTFLTTTFVEQNIFNLMINGAALFFGGKYLERAWGSKEFGKVILIVSIIPNIIATMAYILWGAMVGTNETVQVTLSGGIAIQGTFLVAFKQLVPEHTVTILKGLVKVRVKHFVSLFLFANTLSGFILGTDTAALLAWFGVLTSWTYLRFYKRQYDLSSTSTSGEGSTLKGDASETFAFAMFFPDAIQPPIIFVSSQIYNLLIAVKICTPFSTEEIASSNEQAAARGEAGLPSLLNNAGRGRSMVKREEAERRRALALKALDQRLNVASANRPPPPPSSSTPAPAAAAAAAASSPHPPSVQASAALGSTDFTPEEGNGGRT